MLIRRKHRAERTGSRPGFDGLRMTNSSRDFDDGDSIAYWRANRETFARQAEEFYDYLLKSSPEEE